MLFISKVADDVKKGVFIYFNVMQYMHVKRKVIIQHIILFTVM